MSGADLAVPHIDVGIVANDRAEALAFWSELLGFPVTAELSFPGLTVIRLSVGDATLRLCIPDAPVKALAATGPLEAQTGLRYLTLTVRDLDALVEAVRAAGYPVPLEPKELRPGQRVAQIQDGRGVTIELFEMAQA